MVVCEEDNPLLGDGSGEKALALGDASDGVKVVRKNPRGIKMVCGGVEVAGVGCVMAFGFDMHGEQLGGVAGEWLDGDAGDDFRVAADGFGVEEGHLARGDEGVVVGGEVADAVAVKLEVAVLDLAAVGKVAGVGEGGGDGSVGVKGGVPAAMIEMEMGVDNVRDFIRTNTGGGEGGGKLRLMDVDSSHLFRLLVANTGLDDDDGFSGADDDGVEAEEDAVLVVGGGTFVPECLGDDAEHGSAIEEVGSVGADGKLETAQVQAAAEELGVRSKRSRVHKRGMREAEATHEEDDRVSQALAKS